MVFQGGGGEENHIEFGNSSKYLSMLPKFEKNSRLHTTHIKFRETGSVASFNCSSLYWQNCSNLFSEYKS